MHLNHATAVSAAAMVNYQHYAPAQITTSHGVTTSTGQQQTTISAAGLQQTPFTLHQLTAVQAIQHPTHQAMLHPQHPLVHLLDISTTAAASSSINNNPTAPITPMPVTKIEMPEEIPEPIIDDPRKKKQCHICKNKFRQLTTLRNHMKIHTDERPYKCKHCDKAFRQISTLTNHVKIHTGEKPFKCNICSKDFRQQSTLINHIKTHKVFASLAESNQTPASILNYQTQPTQGTSRKGHSKSIVHSAAAAAAQAQLIHQQQMQQQQQQQQQQGQSTIVTYTPQQRQNITKSLYTGSYNSPQADELVKPYQCKICQKRFPQLSTLHNHERTHIDPKPYKCDTCEKSFSQLATLANHKKIHSGDKPYACAYCCMTFRQQSTLNNHMKTHANQVATITTNSNTAGTAGGGGGAIGQGGNHHHPHHHQAGNNNIPLAAATIMVTPTASGHLQIQPQVEHHPLLHFLDSNTTVSTLSTKEQFAAANNNNNNNNNNHNTNNPNPTGIVAHCLRNSCPDRPFMCSVCRRAFSQQSTLTNHLKTHTGEKPYKCKICESHFRQLSTLNNHMKIHTGEKPYACSYCPKQFRQKSTLTNHKHTNISFNHLPTSTTITSSSSYI